MTIILLNNRNNRAIFVFKCWR